MLSASQYRAGGILLNRCRAAGATPPHRRTAAATKPKLVMDTTISCLPAAPKSGHEAMWIYCTIGRLKSCNDGRPGGRPPTKLKDPLHLKSHARLP